jgi:hypothetical protein
MNALLVVLYVFLFLIAAAEILTARKTVAYKLLWLAIVFFVPVVGVVCYFVLGRDMQMI